MKNLKLVMLVGAFCSSICAKAFSENVDKNIIKIFK